MKKSGVFLAAVAVCMILLTGTAFAAVEFKFAHSGSLEHQYQIGAEQFKKLVDEAIVGLMRSGEFARIYDKWFMSPIPPLGINLQMPMSEKLNDILANMLAMGTTGPPAKMITWAVNLTNNGEIDIDKSDVKFLTSFINENRTFVNLAKSQLLDEIEKLKE